MRTITPDLMYRRLVFLSAFLLSAMSVYAQDIILKRDNSMILSVVEEISDTEIVYKSFDNPTGPKYRISKSDVVQIQYQNGKIERFNSSEPINNKPQEAGSTTANTTTSTSSAVPSTNQAPRSGIMEVTRGILELDGVLIVPKTSDAINILGKEEADNYYSAFKKRRVGICLVSAGATSLVCGSILGVVGGLLSEYPMLYIIEGGVFSLIGVGMLAAGIPTTIVGGHRVRNIADDYNNRQHYAYTLSFGPTSSGFGLSYKF